MAYSRQRPRKVGASGMVKSIAQRRTLTPAALTFSADVLYAHSAKLVGGHPAVALRGSAISDRQPGGKPLGLWRVPAAEGGARRRMRLPCGWAAAPVRRKCGGSTAAGRIQIYAQPPAAVRSSGRRAASQHNYAYASGPRCFQ